MVLLYTLTRSYEESRLWLTMDSMRKGWFSETNDLWPGQSMSLEIERVLRHEKSEYQDILVLER